MTAARAFACALARLVARRRAAYPAITMRAIPLDHLECAAGERHQGFGHGEEQRPQSAELPSFRCILRRCLRGIEIDGDASDVVERTEEMRGAGEAEACDVTPSRHAHAAGVCLFDERAH